MLIRYRGTSWYELSKDELLLSIRPDLTLEEMVDEIRKWAKAIEIDVQFKGSDLVAYNKKVQPITVKHCPILTWWKIPNENDRMLFALKYAESLIME